MDATPDALDAPHVQAVAIAVDVTPGVMGVLGVVVVTEVVMAAAVVMEHAMGVLVVDLAVMDVPDVVLGAQEVALVVVLTLAKEHAELDVDLATAAITD